MSRVRRILRKVYRIARQLPHDGGGSGPWVFLVDPESPNRKVPRLRTLLDVRPDEDLWVELVSYPNRVRRRSIIRGIWNDQKFVATARPLERLISRRKKSGQTRQGSVFVSDNDSSLAAEENASVLDQNT